MYGFIYNTLRDLVLKKFGEEQWFAICDQANVEELKACGLDKHYYDEAYLNRLVDAACTVLSLPKEAVLESFGGHFFETIKISGHSTMLRSLGYNLYGFLMNLDALHDHLSFTFNQMQAPSFRCEKTKNAIILHYNSQREGLHYIVTGIVRSVAKQFFSLEVEVETIKYEKLQQKLCHHYIFQISLKEGHRDEHALERLKGKCSISDLGYDNREASLSPPVEDTDTEMTFEPSQLFLSHTAALSPPPVPTENGGGCPFSGAMAATAASTVAGNGSSQSQSNRSNSTGQMITIDPPEEEEDTSTQDGREMAQLRHRLTLAFGDRGVVYNRLPHSILPELPINRVLSRRGSLVNMNWPISVSFFQNTFPFHIIFDRDLVIRFMGVSLSRLFPDAVKKDHSMTDYFELSRPAVKLTYQNIRASLQNVFVIRTKDTVQLGKKDVKKDPLYFRGQMILASGKDMLVFIASPRIKKVEDLEVQGLYLSDIPVHDVTRDLILLSRHLEAELQLSAELEETKQALEIEKRRVEEEKKRADELLYMMLPQNIAEQLKSHQHTQATHHKSVSILFSDIKGFTTICNKVTPIEVVSMLNDLYTKFDSLLEKHRVYKVETIGDAYMVAAGLQDASIAHAEAVTNMAFGMRAQASEVMEPGSNKTLQIRVGIHTGYVVAGVVGTKMPRYCLFGDTVNMASRMESHGEAGYVHISEATFNQLQKEKLERKASSRFIFYSRGEIYIKGLNEPKQTYFVEPTPEGSSETTQILELPKSPDRLSMVPSIPAHMHYLSSDSAPPHDSILRSPSFVTDDVCKIVKQPYAAPSKSSLVRFTSATSNSSTLSDDDGGVEFLTFKRPSITLQAPGEGRMRSVSEQWVHSKRLSGPEMPVFRTVSEGPVERDNDEVFAQSNTTSTKSSSKPTKNAVLTIVDDRSTSPDSLVIPPQLLSLDASQDSRPVVEGEGRRVESSMKEHAPSKEGSTLSGEETTTHSPEQASYEEPATKTREVTSLPPQSTTDQSCDTNDSAITFSTSQPPMDKAASTSLSDHSHDLVSTPHEKASPLISPPPLPPPSSAPPAAGDLVSTGHDQPISVGSIPPNKVAPANTSPPMIRPSPPESPGAANNVFVTQQSSSMASGSDEIGERLANRRKKGSLGELLQDGEDGATAAAAAVLTGNVSEKRQSKKKCVIS